MQTCPKCGAHRIHRSRAKTQVEELRKLFTAKRLHRCHVCGWRGWGLETAKDVPPSVDRSELRPLDLSLLDAMTTERTPSRRSQAHE